MNYVKASSRMLVWTSSTKIGLNYPSLRTLLRWYHILSSLLVTNTLYEHLQADSTPMLVLQSLYEMSEYFYFNA